MYCRASDRVLWILTLTSFCLTPSYLTSISHRRRWGVHWPWTPSVWPPCTWPSYHTFALQSKLISMIVMSELRRENERKVLIKEMPVSKTSNHTLQLNQDFWTVICILPGFRLFGGQIIVCRVKQQNCRAKCKLTCRSPGPTTPLFKVRGKVVNTGHTVSFLVINININAFTGSPIILAWLAGITDITRSGKEYGTP